ncbi:DUF2309 domain-containing protein [Pareuzebyella sediminis]|uniref:DUF2309 domain-containing protein n=1 Tax=Pareuzebyella sediminis TaxID=2607998 RepID=UPI0011EF8E8C|nr:DUF2309 domain-containing protein [Pareuzebyella sediminis]
MNQQHILKSIDEASKIVGKTWPLYSFVTSNPLSGYEKAPFEEALRSAKKHLNARVFPDSSQFRQAWQKKEISKGVLRSMLKEKGFSESPEYYLQLMDSGENTKVKNGNHDLDRIMAKWLAAFMDEGLAEWEMPNKKDGFYRAWRKLATYDGEIGIKDIRQIPETSSQALMQILEDYPEESYPHIFAYHLAALPGWTGYIKYRTESASLWQQEYPIVLEDYLGVRLWIARHLNAFIMPQDLNPQKDDNHIKLQYIWLKAWEKSWQDQLVGVLNEEKIAVKKPQTENDAPEAQLVFCIDTRSEIIRRHVESKGDYETFGYAGFFGIAMDYQNLKDGLTRKSCPPIVNSAYQVSEIPRTNQKNTFKAYERKKEVLRFQEYFLKRMKNMLPSAFGYVEGSGIYYGLSLLARNLIPGYVYALKQKRNTSHENFCQPEIYKTTDKEAHIHQIPLNEKVAIVKSAFDLIGWNHFAPLVIFVGHGSHSANNPFGSSLDCGACAASPGRHNARMLAKIANRRDVRKSLLENHGIDIPDETLFIGAEHNTTTDDIIIFDSEVPDSHQDKLRNLRVDLKRAQETATKDRLQKASNSVSVAQTKANDWADTRPEWGLAKNAGFIVAPRDLTKKINLGGRCFLHSYDWKMDVTGKALEAIMQGPMVVTQWINNHYYFSTVDNATFGGGSKITHNVTGRFGVVQGNGGDLKVGLPLQSVHQSDQEMYHRPVRLSVLIKAPLDRVSEILSRNENLKALLDNEWIYLMVQDPMRGDDIKRYQRNMQWVSTGAISERKEKDHPKVDREVLELITE